MSALIYVETSIPSFYFETRERTRFQAMREWTREWWEIATVRDTLVTSEAVFAELSFAPEPKRSAATGLLKPLRVLAGGSEVDEVVDAYLTHKLMPRMRSTMRGIWRWRLFIVAVSSRHGTANTSPTRTSSRTSAM